MALVLAGAGALTDRLQAGPGAEGVPGGAPEDRTLEAVRALTSLPIADGAFRVIPEPSAPTFWGEPVALVFSARPVEQSLSDLFRFKVWRAPNGQILRRAELRNLTQTPDAEERLLDATPGCLLWAQGAGGVVTGAVLLDFEHPIPAPEAGVLVRALLSLGDWRAYGVSRAPSRYDLVLNRPVALSGGRCTTAGAELALGDGRVVRLQRDPLHVSPPDLAALQTGGPQPLETFSLLADTLRSFTGLGTAQVVALEALAFEVQDAWVRAHHALVPTSDDRLPLRPAVVAAAPPPRDWPPPDIVADLVRATSPASEGEEGVWSPPEGLSRDGDAESPAVLRTFVRVDVERPFQRVVLFAFDSSRLGFHFAGGTRDPRATTGLRGTGRVPESHRPRLVAAFNGGFKLEHGRFGAIEAGRVMVPPAPGLATIELLVDGQIRFGTWDLDEATDAPTHGLRQNLAPLLAQGQVNPRRAADWGALVARLDASQTPRSALGVTDRGVVVFAWSSATSAESLGRAMQQAQVQFAVHLDMNPGHTGLEFYRSHGSEAPGEHQVTRGVAEMTHRLGRWLATDTRDFFFVTRLPVEAANQRPSDAVGPDQASRRARWVKTFKPGEK